MINSNKCCKDPECNNPQCICDAYCTGAGNAGCRTTDVVWNDEDRVITIKIPYFVLEKDRQGCHDDFTTVADQLYDSYNKGHEWIRLL